MISFLTSYLQNITIVEVIQLYWYNFLLYLSNLTGNLKDFHSTILSGFVKSTSTIISFDEFQWVLLKIFIFILVINLISIVIVWRIYGKSICDRFMSHSTVKEIEELRASVSKLKLPKEYSPRV